MTNRPVIKAAVERVLRGESATSVGAALGVSHDAVSRWANHQGFSLSPRQRQLRLDAFAAVMVAANKVRSAEGTSQAMDYSKITGGERAQYKSSDINHQLIDYQVDVCKAAKDALLPGEFTFFQTSLLDKDFDMTVQSEAFIAIQEKLGKVFLERGLYPVKAYFFPPKRS